MSDAFAIRPLRPEDRPDWDRLWEGYLDFYRHELDRAVTDATFAKLCEQRDGMFGLVAVRTADGRAHSVTAFAHAILHASTWSRTTSCYLEDLYVDPSARGTGAARALVEATASAARERGSERLYWQTQQFNGPARSLYDEVAQLTSYVVYERML